MDRRRLLEGESWQHQRWPGQLHGEGRQRRWGSLVLVVLLLGALALAGCGPAATGEATPAGRTGSAATPSSPQAAQGTPSTTAASATVREQLRALQGSANFPLAAPTDLAGFRVGVAPYVSGPPTQPNVTTVFVDPQAPRRQLYFIQSAVKPAVIAPIGPSSTQVVRGVTATLQEGTRTGPPGQEAPMAALIWEQGGASYRLMGVDVPADRLVQIANSVEPVR